MLTDCLQILVLNLEANGQTCHALLKYVQNLPPAPTFWACPSKTITLPLIAASSFGLWLTHSTSCLTCLSISRPLSADTAHFAVFGHWKITTSCLGNTQTTATSLSAGLSKFHQQPSEQRVNVGGAARFECQIEGVPTPAITWEKDKAAILQEAR